VRVGRVTASQTCTEAPQPETHSKEILEVKRAEAAQEELLVTQVVERPRVRGAVGELECKDQGVLWHALPTRESEAASWRRTEYRVQALGDLTRTRERTHTKRPSVRRHCLTQSTS
jgi:hypothetical protein